MRRCAPYPADLLVLAAYCVLTVLMTWPLTARMSDATVGWEGDNLYFVRQFWWVAHALFDLRASPFFDAESYNPFGYQVARGELVPASTVLAAPLTALRGPVVAYNATLLFTFVATGFGTYLWVGRLTGDRRAGILAGVVAAFLPYRFAHLPGHLSIVCTQWVPWAFYAFERFLERKRIAWGIALGGFLGLVALSAWYYAYSIGILFSIYALIRARPWREQRVIEWLPGLGCAGATLALLVSPFLLPYLELRTGGDLLREIADLEAWSLNFYDFLLPNAWHPIWGDAVAARFPAQRGEWVERGVALGYTATLLALVALVGRRRHPAASALLAVWVVSYAVALGPTLHAGDRQILLPLPPSGVRLVDAMLAPVSSLGSLREEVMITGEAPIPLPSLFLYVFVPFTSGMRVMARFGAWTGLATAALAGMGLATLIRALRGRIGPRPALEPLLTTAGVSLVLLESWSAVPLVALHPREVDRWLAEQPAAVVVELPVDQALRPLQDYYKTVHEQPTIFGPVGDSFYPPERAARARALEDFPSFASLNALRRWGARYVLFTESEIQGWVQMKRRLDRLPGLHFEHTLGGVSVYTIE